MRALSLVLCLLCTAACISYGDGLMCYECLGGNPGCAQGESNKDSMTKRPCSPYGEQVCYKFITKGLQGPITERGCAPRLNPNEPFTCTSDRCVCSQDLCNGAKKLDFALPVALSIGFFLIRWLLDLQS
ncbi:hypothetical protein RvY_17913 [Ramazzottius varieornatus]|uniref:Protein quiver n=1 Tax=Ramazzottius varieornatus TaxID=947166 RepID=A0A1D1W3X2_RAMVA|nr:hypothetical protein RvY_17913 [Ramazzottius varieornatus]